MTDALPDNIPSPEGEFLRNPYVVIEIPNPNDPQLSSRAEFLNICLQAMPIADRYARSVSAYNENQGEAQDFLSEDSPLHIATLIMEYSNISKAAKTLHMNEQRGVKSISDISIVIGNRLRNYLEVDTEADRQQSERIAAQIAENVPEEQREQPKLHYRKRYPVDEGEDETLVISNMDDIREYLVNRSKQVDRLVPSDQQDTAFRESPSVVRLNTPEDFDMYMEIIGEINHDLDNPLTLVYPAVEMVADGVPLQDVKDIIDIGINQMGSTVQASIDHALKKYTKEEMNEQKIIKILEDWRSNLAGYGITLELDQESLSQFGQTIWSKNWFKALLGNLGPNADKGYNVRDENLANSDNPPEILPPRTMHVSGRKVERDGIVYGELIFRDENGLGYPGEIVTEGFEHGNSYWGSDNVAGTGVGMNNHAQVLHNEYGGYIIPRVYREQEKVVDGVRIPGGKIIGAETIVGLPLSS
jgi:hypothetical protein